MILGWGINITRRTVLWGQSIRKFENHKNYPAIFFLYCMRNVVENRDSPVKGANSSAGTEPI